MAASRNRATGGAGGRATLLALVPAAVLFVHARWGGTFEGAASFGPRVVGLAALVALAGLGAHAWRDPLRLATEGARHERAAAAWLPIAVAALSMAQSPVSRAGYALVGLLPWLLLVPAAVALTWRDDARRRVGLCGVAIVLALVASEALVRQAVEGHERAAMPIGHHNLMAVWLLVVLPLPVALLAGRQSAVGSLHTGGGGGRALPQEKGNDGAIGGDAPVVSMLGRVVAWLALLLGVAALFATGSLAGVLGLVVEVGAAVVLFGARSGRKVRRVLVAAVPTLLLAIALWQGPRLADVAAGADPSARARIAYWTAGLRGFVARPFLGWGPGSSSWLVSEHLSPLPGVQPAYEVVTDLHSLPLEILFEGGVAAALAAATVIVLFANARRRELVAATTEERVLSVAALVGLCGAGAAAAVSGVFDLSALGCAAALAAGAALATGTSGGERAPLRAPLLRASAWPLWTVVLGATLLMVPDLRGHWHYDRALRRLPARANAAEPAGAATNAAARGGLDAARRADPRFPLYPFRLALLGGPDASSLDTLDAASAARGLGALWLRAGAPTGDGSIAAKPEWWQLRALERACDLEPFGGLAPFLLAQLLAHPPPTGPGTGRFSWSSVGDDPSLVLLSSRPEPTPAVDRVATLLARAFAAEPRLAAAAQLDADDAERALRLLERVEAWPIGWRAAAVERLSPRPTARDSSDEEEPSSQLVDLALALDAEGSTSLSLFAFRRRPVPAVLVSVPLRAETAAAIDLPPLWSLRDAPAPRWKSSCGWLAD